MLMEKIRILHVCFLFKLKTFILLWKPLKSQDSLQWKKAIHFEFQCLLFFHQVSQISELQMDIQNQV